MQLMDSRSLSEKWVVEGGHSVLQRLYSSIGTSHQEQRVQDAIESNVSNQTER